MEKRVIMILVVCFIVLIGVLTALFLFIPRGDNSPGSVRLNPELNSYKFESILKVHMKTPINTADSQLNYDGYIDKENKSLIISQEWNSFGVEINGENISTTNDNQSGLILVNDGKINESGDSFDISVDPEYESCIEICSNSYDSCSQGCQNNYSICSNEKYSGSFIDHYNSCTNSLQNCIGNCSSAGCSARCEVNRVVDFDAIVNSIDLMSELLSLTKDKNGDFSTDGSLKVITFYPSVYDLQQEDPESYNSISNETLQSVYIKLWLDDNDMLVKDELFLNASSPAFEMSISRIEQRSQINNVQPHVFTIPEEELSEVYE
jgi:hypothetical protein